MAWRLAKTTAAALLVAASSTADGRDLAQWEAGDPQVRAWFRNLMQPDNPMASCCGEADAYYAGTVIESGKTIAVITDTRADIPLGRIPRPVGTRILVPDYKFKWDRGNPTGYGVVFIGGAGTVLCFVQPGGV